MAGQKELQGHMIRQGEQRKRNWGNIIRLPERWMRCVRTTNADIRLRGSGCEHTPSMTNGIILRWIGENSVAQHQQRFLSNMSKSIFCLIRRVSSSCLVFIFIPLIGFHWYSLIRRCFFLLGSMSQMKSSANHARSDRKRRETEKSDRHSR